MGRRSRSGTIDRSLLKEMTPDQLEFWEERAAIMEYCGKLPRDEAEIEAIRDVLGLYEQRSLF